MTLAGERLGTDTLLGWNDEALPYAEPEELLAEIRLDVPTPDWEELSESTLSGCRVTEVRFRTEVFEGRDVFMHGYICRPSEDLLPPVLLIPGGEGAIEPNMAAWHAARTDAVVLSVDWIGVGGSSGIGLWPPSLHAFRFDGHDVRTSFQFHNLRGFVQATEVLLAQRAVDVSRLGVTGSSWGGFYSLLLAGLDARFRHIQPTFGCGFLELGCHQIWQSHMTSMDEADVEEWRRVFDPGRRAHLISGDVAYMQATNDRYFGLEGTMRTYHRIPQAKGLLLARNQDHSAHPFHVLGIDALGAQLRGNLDGVVPQVDAAWSETASVVEVRPHAAPELVTEATVVYSAGSYTGWASRPWRAVAASRVGERWVAEMPVVDPGREIWFFGHVTLGGQGAGSSVVRKVVPEAVGVRRATATYAPAFDFASEPWWELPVGDPGDPAMRAVEENGTTALEISFTQGEHLRGVSFCLEGDLIAEHGYDAVELQLRVPRAEDIPRLKLALFTDYATLAEQAFGIDVADLVGSSTDWHRVVVRFDQLESVPHQHYQFYEPPLRQLDVSRLCAIGFLRPESAYKGTGLLADIRPVRVGEASALATEPSAPTMDPSIAPPLPRYDLYVETPLPADELRRQLRQWEPWRQEVIFSNGVRTSEFVPGKMFTPQPLQNWHHFAARIPDAALRGGRALDVGSNIGHYSIFLRQAFDMAVTGLETNPRNLEVAQFLLKTAGLDGVEYLHADASTWREQTGFRLVLHLGTLDHLRHPFLGLENAAAMLEPDGYLALELQTLVDPVDPYLCRFVGNSDKGTSCCWFLGRGALLRMLEEAGFDRIEILYEWRRPEVIGEDMERLVVLARKPGTSEAGDPAG